MKPRTYILILVLLLTLAMPIGAAAEGAPVSAALDWLKTQQNADGGFSNGFSPESNLSATAEATIAFAAGGYDAGMVQSAEGRSPLDYLYTQVQAGQVQGVGLTAKVVMALTATNLDPTHFAGQDLLAQLEAAYDPDTGSYGGSIFDQALVILALANAGRPIPDGATDYLLAYQTTDGAWNFMGDTAALSGDTNTTALVIQALVAAGRPNDTGRAVAYLQRLQNTDGGWPYQNPSPYGTETDANSTAYVLQAIYALGQSAADWYTNGTDPLGALLALQNASGSFSYQASWPGDNLLATIQAIPALAGVSFTHLKRTPTAAVPQAGATAPAAPPTTLPEAGGVLLPTGVGLIALGLLLTVIARRLA